MTVTAAVAVFDGHHGGGVQATTALRHKLGRPLVVQAGQADAQVRILDGGHAQAEAREQHHLVDPVGVGVGEDPGRRAGVDAGLGAHALVGRATGPGALGVGIGPPFDDHARNPVVAQADLFGEAAEDVEHEGRSLDDVAVGVDDVGPGHRVPLIQSEPACTVSVSVPERSTVPGRASVNDPSRTISVPFTSTCSMPTASA